jgi:hypothetical protein
MKKRIQDRLAKLKRNAERRRQRQLAKQAALAENPVLGLSRGKREGAMVTKTKQTISHPSLNIHLFLASMR